MRQEVADLTLLALGGFVAQLTVRHEAGAALAFGVVLIERVAVLAHLASVERRAGHTVRHGY